MENKKTGLGNSLLLQRTTPDPSAPERPTDAEPQPPAVSQTTQPVGPAPAQPQPKQPRDKCTIYLDPDVNRQLDVVARIEGRQRSQVATDVLRVYLPKYGADA